VRKFTLPKIRLTGARWDVLTVLFVSLTVIVCLLYAAIFIHPQILPMQLQVPTFTPIVTSPAASGARATRPFPTFPPEWTAVFSSQGLQDTTRTPTALGASNVDVSPEPSATITVTSTVTPTVPAGVATLTPSPTLAGSITPGATLTSTTATPLPSPATPLPTSTEAGYPEGYPVVPTWTPLPPGYPYP